jgi:osmotically-inducible protein OsmY
MATLTERIENRLEEAGLHAAVEVSDEAVVLTGIVTTDEERQAAIDIATEEAPDKRIEDNIETSGLLAENIEGIEVAEMATEPGEPSIPGTSDEDTLAGDFQDQRLLKNPLAASGPSDNTEDDLVAEGDVSYVPPTDPVRTPDNEVLGGFQITSMDHVGVQRSSEGELGDEAIADAIRRELAEDAATAGLEVEVSVERGIVRLRGRVRDLIDAESAEEVASRVPGVLEVQENLEVEEV